MVFAVQIYLSSFSPCCPFAKSSNGWFPGCNKLFMPKVILKMFFQLISLLPSTVFSAHQPSHLAYAFCHDETCLLNVPWRHLDGQAFSCWNTLHDAWCYFGEVLNPHLVGLTSTSSYFGNAKNHHCMFILSMPLTVWKTSVFSFQHWNFDLTLVVPHIWKLWCSPNHPLHLFCFCWGIWIAHSNASATSTWIWNQKNSDSI